MIKDLFSLREKEIFSIVRALKEFEIVVIGGYAVNAYTLPRFSVDCDIVISNQAELEKIEALIKKFGYKKVRPPGKAIYTGSFSRYEKKLDNNFAVSIDILIGTVSDRMTGVNFVANWIFENSKIQVLKGKTITEEIKVKIIDRDALLVMKMISCRSTDIRDVFMMLPNATDKEWIKSEITARYDLHDRISKIIEKVNSKQFKDGLSGVYGAFDQKVFEKHKKAIFAFYPNVNV